MKSQGKASAPFPFWVPRGRNDVAGHGRVDLGYKLGLFPFLSFYLSLADQRSTMPMILNIHTPSHSFALPYRQGESAAALFERIARKAGLPKGDAVEALKEGRDGAGLRYEFDGGRWDLSDGEHVVAVWIVLLLTRSPQTTISRFCCSGTTHQQPNTLPCTSLRPT